MNKTVIIKPGQKPTKEQLIEVEEAKRQPITFDEDCPELSPSMVKAFQCISAQRKRRKNA